MPPRHLPSGTQIGDHYEIEDVIGEGGMGVVYRARDHALGRTVAIKALHTNLLGDADIRRRFGREARVMMGWSHPGIVTAFDCVETADLHAMVMEFVDGPTLEDHLERWGGPLPLSELQPLFSDMLEAMEAAHERGVVHRDLKPQNILLCPDDRGLNPKVADFGIAKVVEGTAYTMTGALLGTTRYMSPEQVQSPRSVDVRSDIYALGVTLYRVATGRCPFESDNHYELMMAHVNQEPTPPSRYRPDLPPPLDELILSALAKDPEDRPQRCEQLRQRLIAALDDVPQTDRSTSSTPRSPVVRGDDGCELRLVDAGSILYGPSRRRVYLDAYYLARNPVTNRQFETFVQVTGYRPSDELADRFLAHWRGERCPADIADHPVVNVSWLDARAYCAWAGRRSPPKRSGRRARAATTGANTRGGGPSPRPPAQTMDARAAAPPHRSGRSPTARRRTDCSTWPATCGNGAKTSTIPASTCGAPNATRATRSAPARCRTSCAAGRSTTTPGPCVRSRARASTPPSASTTWAFAARCSRRTRATPSLARTHPRAQAQLVHRAAARRRVWIVAAVEAGPSARANPPRATTTATIATALFHRHRMMAALTARRGPRRADAKHLKNRVTASRATRPGRVT